MIPLNSNLSALRRSPIRLFTNLARETPGCASLTIGEPDFDTPDFIKEAGIKAINDNKTKYTPAVGTVSLRKAISDSLKKSYSVRYGAEHPFYLMIFPLGQDYSAAHTVSIRKQEGALTFESVP